MYTLPVQIKKTIAFPRLSSKNVLKYEIYAKFKDDTYTSGIRTELLDTIENSSVPSPVEKDMECEYSVNYTYPLPKNIYIDKDHRMRVFVDGILISSLWYTANFYAKIFTINTNKIAIHNDTKISIKYYEDIISKDYFLDENCELFVKPIFLESYHYGDHNIII
jgi:hypothetical protein